MKNLHLTLFMLFINISTLNYPMCCCCRKEQKQVEQHNTISPKSQLMQLITNADLEGIRIFTQDGGIPYIDEEACNLAKSKFKATQVNNPAQFSTCNEFLVMAMVQAFAPNDVKKKLGLPVSEA